jgi:hypothetical protein
MSTTLLALFLLLLAIASCGQTPPPIPSESDRALLKTLRREHPRLIATKEDLQRLQETIRREPLAQRWRDQLRQQAEMVLEEPPVERKLIGPRLLHQSRRALDRIYLLALMYRLEGDRRFAERARRELLAVCAFINWNPLHFLDVAEMTHAVAIGYDWLYDFWTAEERVTLRNAIVNLGLKPSLPINGRQPWWLNVDHNWNQVCNGGMTLGALAVAEDEPELAAYILGRSLNAVKKAMASYAPDGGWAEGPGYWHYATQYNVYMLAGLESALGTDFRLSELPGFSSTGLFPLHFTGSTGRTFNYADGGDRLGSASELFWLARNFRRPLFAWMQRQSVRSPSPLDLLWFDPHGGDPKSAKIPLDAHYQGIGVVFLRSAWEDPNALFVGFKGGDNRANHSHLDLGTFVLDAEGARWAIDLGRDDYDLPGYFSQTQRWTYYRNRTEGHNTLLLDHANQVTTARAPILAFSASSRRAQAVADLTAGYAGKATRVWRGVALLDRKAVLIQDEIEAAQPVEAIWQMHTPADIELHGRRAVLRQPNAGDMEASLLEPDGALFEVVSAAQPAPQNPNAGIVKLRVRLPEKVTACRIVVVIRPARFSRTPLPARIAPLSEWIASRP